MVSLSDEEKRKFAAYCQQQVATNEGLIKQMETLGAAGEIMAKRARVEALAYGFVARDLLAWETQTL